MRRADIEVPNTAVDVDSWAVSACYPQGSDHVLLGQVDAVDGGLVEELDPHFIRPFGSGNGNDRKPAYQKHRSGGSNQNHKKKNYLSI